MVYVGPLFVAYFPLFVSLAVAVLQNVTVDDAVLTGAVVPQYLPSPSSWNIGNECSGCFVQPNPASAYNGTWHDATFSPTGNVSQAIEFTFTGSALYIFFILANNVPYATTFTDLQFVLDNEVAVNTYVHLPGSTNNYQYNVPVYVNESLASGWHNMLVQPVNSTSAGNVLMLFDYLIYTMDSTLSSVSPSALATSTSPSTPTSSSQTLGTTTSSGQSTGAIIGGVLAGLFALISILLFFCRWRNKRRSASRRLAGEDVMVDPFDGPVSVAQTSHAGATFKLPARPVGSSLDEPAPGLQVSPPIVTPQLSIPSPSATAAASSDDARPSVDSADLLQQVGLLRDEVARLRELHEAPPEYSTYRAD